MTEVSQRLAEREAAAPLQASPTRVTKQSEAILLPGIDKVTTAEEAVRLAAVANRNDCLILLAVADDQLLGLLTIMHQQDHPGAGEVGLVVDQPYWGQGIGRLLLEEGQYWYEHYSSLDRLVLTVYEENARARHLYRALGFTESGHLQEPLPAGGSKPAVAMTYQAK